MHVVVLVAGGLALGGCPLEGNRAAAPVKKPAAPDYQQAAAAPAGNVNRASCYNAADLSVMRVRMLQQELTVATLQCQTGGGARAFEAIYTSFLANTRPSSGQRPVLATGGRSQALQCRRDGDRDVQPHAQRAPVDKEFCSRSRARWNGQWIPRRRRSPWCRRPTTWGRR